MMPIKPSCILLALGLVGGCVSSSVQQGMAIGAVSGTAGGAGVGLLISDQDLLGSPATRETGDTSIDTSMGLGAGMLIGAVFGAIVGGMVGHVNDGPEAEVAVLPADEPGEEDFDLGLEGDDEAAADDSARAPGPLAF